jgi:hypothetical protein
MIASKEREREESLHERKCGEREKRENEMNTGERRNDHKI